MTDDDDVADEARELARDLAHLVLPFGVPMDPTEAYLYGLLHAVMSADLAAGVSGVTCRFPPLNVLCPERAERLLSYEWIVHNVASRDAQWLAGRLRGIAAILDRKETT